MLSTSLKLNLLLVFATALSGCGAVRVHHNLEQPTAQTLTASVGGKIFRINKSGDLPNIIGGRDILGAQVERGYTDLTLAGIEGQVLMLELTDVDKSSSATTMDRFNRKNQISINNKITIGNEAVPKPRLLQFDTTNKGI